MKMDHKAIEQIVLDIINKLENNSAVEEPSRKPNLLVINATEQDPIEQLKKEWHVCSESAVSLNTQTDFQEVIFFHCSQDLLVKGALGIADTPESELLAKFLLQGKPIQLIPSKELEWMMKPDVNVHKESVYRSHLLAYKKQLESFGVKFRSLASFAKAGVNEERANHLTFEGKLLTEQGVKDSREDSILIGSSTIVTPLARDAARNLGKTIVVVESN